LPQRHADYFRERFCCISHDFIERSFAMANEFVLTPAAWLQPASLFNADAEGRAARDWYRPCRVEAPSNSD
jgi:hypothetical protein